LERLELNTG